MLQLEGKLSISRVTGGRNYISISLQDKNSLLHVVDIEVDPETFGNLITGLSAQSVSYEVDFNDLQNLGKKLENKVENVKINTNSYSKEELIAAVEKVISPYEIGGWKAEIESSLGRQGATFDNEHGRWARIWFRRYV